MEGSPNNCPLTCVYNHNLDYGKIRKGWCLFEFNERGSCRRSNNCWFSHDIPDAVRENNEVRANIHETLNRIQKFRQLQQKGRLPILLKSQARSTITAHKQHFLGEPSGPALQGPQMFQGRGANNPRLN
jgi:hypothetical protein